MHQPPRRSKQRKTSTRRSFLKASSGLLGGLPCGIGRAFAADPPPGPAPDDEFIRVAPDRWTFESAGTKRRFIPFGSNLVLCSKDDLNIFGPRYATGRYRDILVASAAVNINLLKVFLPIHALLPDPQVPGEVHIAPGYLDNLDDFLGLCRTYHIRAVITFSEWGGHRCRWWQDGGQYFGRRPWRTDPGVDSLDILVRFWKTLAARLRNSPTVFSYSPCVEWSMPTGNMTPPWAPAEDQIGLVPGATALWYWRAWLLAKYKTLDKVNAAWGTKHQLPDQIPVVSYTYDGAARRYADPETKILDYQNFREWATLRCFSPQLAAIRAADPNHMITISNHMRQWNLWEGAARHFLGFTAAEEKPLVDYVTHHANYDEAELKPGRTVADIVREVQVMARFCHAGKPMPVVIEEFTFGSRDPKQTSEVQSALIRNTVGHASGWTTWYLQYPDGPNVADAAHPSAWLTADLTPTPWGHAARDLARELVQATLTRLSPARIINLTRSVELVPKTLGTLMALARQPQPDAHPTDYAFPHEPDLDTVLPLS